MQHAIGQATPEDYTIAAHSWLRGLCQLHHTLFEQKPPTLFDLCQ